MRFGCCLNMVATEPGGTGIEQVEALAQTGYDYAELPLAEITKLPEAEFKALVRRVEASGVRCEVCNNFFPKDARLTGQGRNLEKVLALATKSLQRAAELGAIYVVFGSGPAKNVPAGFPLSEGYRQVVELLQHIAPLARQHGIRVVIEPLRKPECNLINTYEEGCQLCRDVADANVQVLVDYYHLCYENEPLEHLRRQPQRLQHVHFSSPKRGFPSPTDGHDYTPLAETLKDIGYSGHISCEAYSDKFADAAAKALRLMQTYFS